MVNFSDNFPALKSRNPSDGAPAPGNAPWFGGAGATTPGAAGAPGAAIGGLQAGGIAAAGGFTLGNASSAPAPGSVPLFGGAGAATGSGGALGANMARLQARGVAAAGGSPQGNSGSAPSFGGNFTAPLSGTLGAGFGGAPPFGTPTTIGGAQAGGMAAAGGGAPGNSGSAPALDGWLDELSASSVSALSHGTVERGLPLGGFALGSSASAPATGSAPSFGGLGASAPAGGAMGTGFGGAKPVGKAATFGGAQAGGGTPAAHPLPLTGFGAGQPPAAPHQTLTGLGAAPPPPAVSGEVSRDVEGEMGEAAEALIRESKVIQRARFVSPCPAIKGGFRHNHYDSSSTPALGSTSPLLLVSTH